MSCCGSQNHLKRSAQNTTLGVDFLNGKFPAMPVRHRKGRERTGVAVDFADTDRTVLRHSAAEGLK